MCWTGAQSSSSQICSYMATRASRSSPKTRTLIKPCEVIVDLGCTPGSWAQYTRRKLAGKEGGGITGTIIGLDLLPMEPIADVTFIQGDFREDVVLDQLAIVLEGRKT